MGNENKKEAKDENFAEKEKLWEEEYNKVIAEASISASTWEELSEKLSKHIDDDDQIEKEWELRFDRILKRSA
jgi:hypothetical protein